MIFLTNTYTIYRSYVTTISVSSDLNPTGSSLLIISEIFDALLWVTVALLACRTDTRRLEFITLVCRCPLLTPFTPAKMENIPASKETLGFVTNRNEMVEKKNHYTYMHLTYSFALVSFLKSKLEHIWITCNYMNIFNTEKYRPILSQIELTQILLLCIIPKSSFLFLCIILFCSNVPFVLMPGEDSLNFRTSLHTEA